MCRRLCRFQSQQLGHAGVLLRVAPKEIERRHRLDGRIDDHPISDQASRRFRHNRQHTARQQKRKDRKSDQRKGDACYQDLLSK